MMKIEIADNAGFCFGVKRAIELAENAAAKYGGTATITTREGWFELRVLIPLGQPQQE